jgi:hypothetical protein
MGLRGKNLHFMILGSAQGNTLKPSVITITDSKKAIAHGAGLGKQDLYPN